MRRRIVRLTVALAAVTIVIFGVPLAVGVAQYLLADQYSELERVAGASAIAVSGDLRGAAQHRQGSARPPRSRCMTTTGCRSAASGRIKSRWSRTP